MSKIDRQRTKNNDMKLIKGNASIYVMAEKDANIFSLKILGALSLLALLSIVLTYLGVFSVQKSVILVSMLSTFVLLSLPTVLYIILDKLKKIKHPAIESGWFLVTIITCVFLGIGLTCISLSFHATILLAIPPLMASQYHYRKRAFIIVLIATILLVPIAVYGSFFLGAPDRNFLKGEITETEAMVLANRIPLATTKRMTELFTHYTLPLLFGVIVIVLLVTGITRRNGKMLRIQTELSEKIREEMENRNKAQNQVIEMLTSLIETRDVSTGTHILRTKTIVELIAKAMQKEPDYRDILTDETIERMVQAAPLHDIGKIIVSDSILLKPAKLTPEEFETMKKHTTVGGKLVKKLFLDMNDPAFLQMAEDIALCHHEKWDGTGYPCGLKKDAIPLCARIMAVADVYDALVSARVYKPAFPPEEALKILFSENATRFDPDIMKVVEKIKDDLKALADTSRNGAATTGTDVSA